MSRSVKEIHIVKVHLIADEKKPDIEILIDIDRTSYHTGIQWVYKFSIDEISKICSKIEFEIRVLDSSIARYIIIRIAELARELKTERGKIIAEKFEGLDLTLFEEE
jgi:hypothetical protein